jgi:hypothetical protein
VLLVDEGSGVRRLAPMAARYRERYQETAKRLGEQRGKKIACVEVARRLAEAIWHVLPRNQPFAPAGRPEFLAARRHSLRIAPRERTFHQPDPAAAGDGEMSAAPPHDEGST